MRQRRVKDHEIYHSVVVVTLLQIMYNVVVIIMYNAVVIIMYIM